MPNMRIVELSELAEMVGETVPCVTGTLLNLYPMKTGEGKYGPWQVQPGQIEADGTKIRVSFWNRAALLHDKIGETITIECKASEKGLTGITVTENEYQGQKRVELKIGKSARVYFGNQEESKLPSDHLPAPRKEEEAPTIPPRKYISREENKDPHNEVVDDKTLVRKKIAQKANLMRLCYAAARWSVAEDGFFLDQPYGMDLAKCRATRFYIDSAREGLHLKLSDKPEPLQNKEESLENEDLKEDAIF